VILIDRNDDLTVTTGGQPLPIPGRYCHTPFGVKTDFGGPSKHNLTDGRRFRSSGAKYGRAAPFLPLLSTFPHYRWRPRRPSTNKTD
jgi:hypothetical protein